MHLVCIRQFGSFLPGDDYPEEVPDDASFDTAYFAVKPSEADLPNTPTLRSSSRQKEDDR